MDDAQQHRLEIIVDGSKCKLKGHLSDSTNLHAFKNVLASIGEINMFDLSSISWHGVQRFYELLEDIGKEFILTDVPPHIYRTLLLLLDPAKKIKVRSFMLEVFDTSESKRQILVTMDKAVDLARKQGAFANWDDGSKISGSLHHLCRPCFGNTNEPEINFTSKWCRDNREICIFFYEYSCFMRVILEMCSLAQDSTASLIEESLHQICARIANLESGLKSLDPNFSETKSQTLMSLMPHIHDVSKSVVENINLSSNTFEAVAQTFEAMFVNNTMNSSEPLFEQMSHFLNFTSQITPISKSLEDVGVELGDHILRYGEISSLRKSFDAFRGKEITGKNVAVLRQKLKYDPSKNLTWDETIKDVHVEFKAIQNELGKCIIALQGFDLIRQVLEHRISEIDIFQQMMPKVKSKEITWEAMRDKVQAQIIDRLVTDQEKYSFAFFFPNVQLNKPEEKLTPGDSFFF